MSATAPFNPASFAASMITAQGAALRAAQRAFVDAASASNRYWSQSAALLLSMSSPTSTGAGANGSIAAFGPAAEKLPGGPKDVPEGFEVTFTREVTTDLIEAFGEVSGDHSRLHYDGEYAGRTQFGSRIAHGMLSAGFVSAALSRLPGLVVYLSQDLKFMKPVKPGDVVTARCVVIERPAGKAWARLRTTCTLADGEVVLDGEAKVLIASEPA